MTIRMLAYVALTDLLSRRGRWTVVTALFTISFATCVCFACYALVWGKKNVDVHRIEQEPWSLVVRVGNAHSTRGKLTEQALAEIEEHLQKALPDPRAIRGIQPYRSCASSGLSVFQTPSGTDIVLSGRTLFSKDDVKDLFLQGQEISVGHSPFDPALKGQGITVTPNALLKLGFENTPQLPVNLKFSPNGKINKNVPIIGVFSQNLPDRYDFVITEAFEELLLREPDRYAHVRTGPLPPAWLAGNGAIDWKQILSSTDDNHRELLDAGLSKINSLDVYEDGLRLQAGFFDESSNSSLDSLTEAEWQTIVLNINDVMTSRTGTDGGEFKNIRFDRQDNRNLEDLPYDLVNIYTNSAMCLKPIADICDQYVKGFNDESTINRDVIARMESINQSYLMAMNIANSQQLIILALSGCCLIVLQVLRASEKSGEIGMLRAMGMSRTSVMQFMFVQAAALGLAGWLLGICFGFIGAYSVANYLYDSTSEIRLGVVTPAWFPFLIGLVALSLSLLSTLVSCIRLVRHSPALLLH